MPAPNPQPIQEAQNIRMSKTESINCATISTSMRSAQRDARVAVELGLICASLVLIYLKHRASESFRWHLGRKPISPATVEHGMFEMSQVQIHQTF